MTIPHIPPGRAARLAPMICAGRTNAEIAHELHLGIETIKGNVHALRRRHGARNRTELAAILARREAP